MKNLGPYVDIKSICRYVLNKRENKFPKIFVEKI